MSTQYSIPSSLCPSNPSTFPFLHSLQLTIHPYNYLPTYPFIQPTINPTICPFIHPCIHFIIHPLSTHYQYTTLYLSIYPSKNSCHHPSNHLFTHPYILWLIHFFIYPTAWPPIHSFKHVFIISPCSHPTIYSFNYTSINTSNTPSPLMRGKKNIQR